MSHKKRIAFAACLMAMFIGLGGYAAYQLYLSYDAYTQGDQTYKQIMQQVISDNSSSKTITSSDEEQSPSDEVGQLDIPEHKVDFDALKAINADSIGWLYCPDTVIDYPVMAADDYTCYLYHLPDGTYNINGSLFLDYSSPPDFSGRLSVIYGHSMKTGKMFGTLTEYKNQSYFEQHPYLYLYTETHNYRIALIYGAVISDSQWSENGYAQDADGLLKYARAHTTFETSQTSQIYSADQHLLVLSTCSYEYSGARYFVVGVLQPA
jgi:sortase B